jgi:hypothetical protein
MGNIYTFSIRETAWGVDMMSGKTERRGFGELASPHPRFVLFIDYFHIYIWIGFLNWSPEFPGLDLLLWQEIRWESLRNFLMFVRKRSWRRKKNKCIQASILCFFIIHYKFAVFPL